MDERLPPLRAVAWRRPHLPLRDNELTETFDAKLRKTSLEALLADCLRARAREDPLLLVLDECHWIDPLSHDLLEIVGRLSAVLPILLVTAYRPPELHRFAAAAEGAGVSPGSRINRLPNFHQIRLTGFTPAQAEELIGLKLEQFFGSPVRRPG